MDISRETTICCERNGCNAIAREQTDGRIWTQFVVDGEVSGWTNAASWEQAIGFAHAHVLTHETDISDDQLAQLCGYYDCFYDKENACVLCLRKPSAKAVETFRREKMRAVELCKNLGLYRRLTNGKVDYINASVPYGCLLQKSSHGASGALSFSFLNRGLWNGDSPDDVVESVSVSTEGYCNATVFYAIDRKLPASEKNARNAAIIISDIGAWQRFFGVLPMSTVENDAKQVAHLIEKYGTFCKARELLRHYGECWKEGSEWGKTLTVTYDPFV
ncbi:MAG: hypothetical protein IJS15_02585 [Victivallales bacterium]|nr:hypothetical protein [Victivallales bacterium]